MDKNLLYFTNSYPYGIGEQWKKNELDVLVNYFNQITVIPFSYGGNFNQPKTLPKNVHLETPLYEKEGFFISKVDWIKILFSRYILIFLTEFFSKKVYLTKAHLINWAVACKQVLLLSQHKRLNKILDNANENTVLYFFWGKGTCELIPFKKKLKAKVIAVRLHGYDLYEERNFGYIPFRNFLFNRVNYLLPISINGANYLKNNSSEKFLSKINMLRLGTLSNGKQASKSTDNVIRITSCSSIIPLKRLHIMVQSLNYLTVPVEWRHIGDGPLQKEIQLLVEENKLNNQFIFEGFIPSQEIQNQYTNRNIDLFVNTSSTEGVPVSIMEAFAAGIPVLATNVGGTSEIVDDTVGGLLPADLTPECLAKKIMTFYHLPEIKKEKLRQNAYQRFQEKCDANFWANQLGKLLTS